jgi:hypothetical protein
MFTDTEVDAAIAGYLEAALWATNADHLDPEGSGAAGSLDDHFSIDDIAPEALVQVREDVTAFCQDNARDLSAVALSGHLGRVGFLFFLNRNGHGSGFWDEGNAPAFTRLSDAAKAYGSQDFYAGDDGKVHAA